MSGTAVFWLRSLRNFCSFAFTCNQLSVCNFYLKSSWQTYTHTHTHARNLITHVYVYVFLYMCVYVFSIRFPPFIIFTYFFSTWWANFLRPKTNLKQVLVVLLFFCFTKQHICFIILSGAGVCLFRSPINPSHSPFHFNKRCVSSLKLNFRS